MYDSRDGKMSEQQLDAARIELKKSIHDIAVAENLTDIVADHLRGSLNLTGLMIVVITSSSCLEFLLTQDSSDLSQLHRRASEATDKLAFFIGKKREACSLSEDELLELERKHRDMSSMVRLLRSLDHLSTEEEKFSGILETLKKVARNIRSRDH